jgi:hypothetical protein
LGVRIFPGAPDEIYVLVYFITDSFNDYWKYSYDVLDKKEFSEPISIEDITYTPAKKNSPLITNQKKFKDRLVHCYWALVFIIFYLFLYIFAGLLG